MLHAVSATCLEKKWLGYDRYHTNGQDLNTEILSQAIKIEGWLREKGDETNSLLRTLSHGKSLDHSFYGLRLNLTASTYGSLKK